MNLGTRILIVLAAACLVSTSVAETITYEYDELHRLIHVTYDGGAWIRYEYDPVGNRLLDVMNSTPGVGYLYVTVDPPGSASIARVPDEVWYDTDEEIRLTPMPEGECVFQHWSGDDVPPGQETADPLTITMSSYGYMHVVAHFTSPFGHMDEDCDDDGTPDGCEWADTNANEVLDDCDPLIGYSVLTLENTCEYGENAPDQFFDVWDAGLPDTQLDYTLACDQDWLWCDPDSGTSTGDPNTITVHYETTELPVGQHLATITISDPGAGNNDQTIAVTLEVTGRAAVCRDEQTLTVVCDYGENAVDQFFEVWNCGLPGTTLMYTIEDDADWLWCDPNEGSSTGEHNQITVQFDTDELPAGQHFATITVSDPDAAYSPRTLLVVLTVACSADGWSLWDMNYDGFVSLIGDVPPFVDCVYFSDCYCPGSGCLCPGDCNASGFLSIIGDVQCFVECAYFGECDEPRDGGGQSGKRADGTFTIGGAVYTDLNDPLASGLEGIRIRVTQLKATPSTGDTAARSPLRSDSTEFTAPGHKPTWLTSSGTWGLWRIDGLRPGWYAVTASAPGYALEHTQAGAGTTQSTIKILVGPVNESVNQSIQFLASE